jgi:hypothetical protein
MEGYLVVETHQRDVLVHFENHFEVKTAFVLGTMFVFDGS